MARQRKFPVGVRNDTKPQMGCLRGQTWDVVMVVLPDGSVVEGYMEYTWGTRFYFEHDGKWYSASNLAFSESGNGGATKYDLRAPESFGI